MMSQFTQTLAEAKAAVVAGRDDGIACPCCDQFCKVYKRKLNANMVRGLLWLYKTAGETSDWLYVPGQQPSWLAKSRELPKCRHWRLAEQRDNDDTAKKDSGYWRVTSDGCDFAERRMRVPSHCHLYDNEIVGWSDTKVTIEEALGEKFSYAELMGRSTLFPNG
jgi:hypothetical protein